MEVLAISAVNPKLNKAGHATYNTSFGENSSRADEVIYKLAVAKTTEQAKERQKNVKRLLYSVPLLASLSVAVLHKGNSKVLNREISGLAGKLAEGVKSGTGWAALLGLGVVIGAGDAAIAKKSESFRNFRKNNPFLSFVADVGVFLAASMAIPMGIRKLTSKIKPQHYAKMSNGIQNVAGHVNRIKTPKFIKNIGTKVSKMIPDAVKNYKAPDFVKKTGNFAKAIGKTLLSWAPELALFTAIFESFNNRARIASDLSRNYTEINQAMEEN